MKLGVTAADWPAVSDLLDEALSLPRGERARFVESLSGERARLRETLAAMLAHEGVETDRFWEGPPPHLLAAASPEGPLGPEPGSRIGPYRLVSSLGEGGMGTVWLAERDDAMVRRKVALKLPHLGWNAAMSARLEREREILASLEHPHIARLYDAGVDASGRPYLAIEYVEGEPIDFWCTSRHLDVHARLELLVQVADAVAYAHSRLVLHRDLKPANVLVGSDGQVRLLDFGIAKLLDDDLASATALTSVSGRAMTISYASPEQVRGDPLTTASDVCSLGVVAYEVLTDAKPYRLQRGSAAELEEAILGADIPSPSSQPNSAATRQALRGDVDAIVRKALQAELWRRYASVDAFSTDLRQHLRGLPVSARPDAWTYRFGKTLRRHRYAFASAGFVMATTLVGAGAALWQARQARLEAVRADAVQSFLKDIFVSSSARQSDPERARKVTARELLDLGSSKLDAALAAQPTAHLQLTRLMRDLYSDLGLAQQSVPLARRAAELAAREYGRDSVEHLRELIALSAELQQDGGGMSERQSVIDRALAILSGLPDRPSVERMRLYGQLAELHASGDLGKSARFAEQAISDARASGGPADLAGMLETAGYTAMKQRRFQVAETLLAEAVAIGERVSATPEFDTLRRRTYLGEVQAQQLRIDAAESNLKQALETSFRLNGEASLDTTQIRLRLGYVLAGAGRLDEGLLLTRKAVEVLDGSARTDTFTLPYALQNLGDILHDKGRLIEASQVFRRALALRDRVRPDTTVAAEIRVALAATFVDMGQKEDAAILLAQASDIYRRNGAKDGDRVWEPSLIVGLQLARQRGDTDSQQGLIRALDRLWFADEQISRGRLFGLLFHAQSSIENGRTEDAAEMLGRARAALVERSVLGQLPRFDGRRLWLCGRLAAAGGDPDTASRMFDQARAIYGSNFEVDSEPLRELAKSEVALRAATAGAAVKTPSARSAPNCT